MEFEVREAIILEGQTIVYGTLHGPQDAWIRFLQFQVPDAAWKPLSVAALADRLMRQMHGEGEDQPLW